MKLWMQDLSILWLKRLTWAYFPGLRCTFETMFCQDFGVNRTDYPSGLPFSRESWMIAHCLPWSFWAATEIVNPFCPWGRWGPLMLSVLFPKRLEHYKCPLLCSKIQERILNKALSRFLCWIVPLSNCVDNWLAKLIMFENQFPSHYYKIAKSHRFNSKLIVQPAKN